MDRERLAELIDEAAVEIDGKMKLACAKAFIIAAENGVPVGEVGAVCNEKDIRIASCQLGCFE